MASNSTTSNFTNQIKTNYPYRGQNNDSQGFRDNFSAIKNALTSADTDIQTLKGSLISNNTTSNFYDHRIVRAVFQDCADQVYASSDSSGSIQIDYTQGGYQTFSLTGDTTFTVTGFPTTVDGLTANAYGSVIIACIPAFTLAVTFNESYIAVGAGSTSITENITSTTFWQIWSSDGGVNIYFSKIGNNSNTTATAIANSITALNSLTIRENTYTTSTTSATVVSSGGKSGVLALLPDRVSETLNSISINSPSNTTQFQLANSDGRIKVGATIFLPTTSTQFIVSSVNASSIGATPAADSAHLPTFPVSVTFTNPTFSLQTTVATIATAEPATLVGSLSDINGQIHASSTTLYISYKDYDGLTPSWFKVSDDSVARKLATGTSATTVSISNSSTVLATTEFTQNLVSAAIYGGIEGALPPGVITLWYGAIANIPYGWQLCDGTNGSPDLRGKFVIGASEDNAHSTATTTITGLQTITGGNANSTLVSHTHIAGSVVTDPGHHHNSQYDGRTPGSIDYTGAGSEIGGMGTGYTYPTTDSVTGITVSTSILAAGSGDGTNANLPPYYALAYIIKTI